MSTYAYGFKVIELTIDDFKDLVQSLNDAQALLTDQDQTPDIHHEYRWDLVRRYKESLSPTEWENLPIKIVVNQ